MSTTLITGANRGLGLEFCRQLDARGDTVIGVCRGTSAGLERLGVRVESGVDVTADTDVAALAGRLSGETIDLLIHNAGILRRVSLEELDFEQIRTQLEVNALAPLRVTRGLLDNLHAGSRIAIVTSLMGSLADNTSGGHYGYRMSKAAVNMAGVSLACDLQSRGIAVILVHPGFVRTDMTGKQGNVDADESVSGMLERIDALTLETTGEFWHSNGERLPW